MSDGYDALIVFVVTTAFNMLFITAALAGLYSYFSRCDEQRKNEIIRAHVKINCLRNEVAQWLLMHPAAEPVSPPSLCMPPMAQPVAPTELTPYQIYLDASRQLWKLQAHGEEHTEFADYLRNVMEENFNQLNALEQERAEHEAADGWKHI
jgi:hypothetical protein